MEYSQLPTTIISPFSSKVLTLQPLDDKEALGHFFDDCTEFDSSVACYSDKSGKEQIYVPIED